MTSAIVPFSLQNDPVTLFQIVPVDHRQVPRYHQRPGEYFYVRLICVLRMRCSLELDSLKLSRTQTRLSRT